VDVNNAIIERGIAHTSLMKGWKVRGEFRKGRHKQGTLQGRGDFNVADVSDT
jgi:hypothetical protein